MKEKLNGHTCARASHGPLCCNCLIASSTPVVDTHPWAVLGIKVRVWCPSTLATGSDGNRSAFSELEKESDRMTMGDMSSFTAGCHLEHT